MKRLTNTLILLTVICAVIWTTPQKAAAQGASVSFQVFYDELSPYGTWVQNPDYGYVWVPNVDAGFTPYGTNGYWVYTDLGWTWVSNYPWGWAPFHYGRWYNDPGYGPIWVPDNEWGPGWVTWRRSEGYYGWAPIEPGISISVAYSSGYNVPNDRWVFVRDHDFGRTNINNYYVDRSRNVTIINNSTVINNVQTDHSRNVTYHGGPDRTEVQQRSGRVITPVAIKESNKPGQAITGNELQIYKPRVQKSTPAEPKPAPAKVAGSLKEVKTPLQRTIENQPQKGGQETRKSLQSKPADHQAAQQPTRSRQVNQPVKQQPAQPQHNNQPVVQHQTLPPRQTNQPVQEPARQQQNSQPVQRQPMQQPQHNIPPPMQPPAQPQRSQPVQRQPVPQPQNNPPPARPPQNIQPPRQQPMQPPPQREGERPH